jgi:dinuclear metal center YbgI/SA1388 family protein
MTVGEIITYLESIAPPALQESYDNAGLITGHHGQECFGALITLDATEEVIQEAIEKGLNMVIAHHPIVFKGLKRFNGKNYVERAIILAIKNDIAIYAIHTNLDNVIKGVNGKIAAKLGLQDTRVLLPKDQQLRKLVTFSPPEHAEALRQAIFTAGGGYLGKYSECSFNQEGTGTFKPEEGADPFVGEIGKRHESKEIKIEIIFPSYLQDKLVAAMTEAHPYEEVAYDIISLGNYLSDAGSGIIGDLPEAVEPSQLFATLKSSFNLKVIRHTKELNRKVKKVAICGGAGSFLIGTAISNKADIYITSDIKYHEFFDADGRIIVADIGHYESEQFTVELLADLIKEKYTNFAVLKTETNTNPVSYYM